MTPFVTGEWVKLALKSDVPHTFGTIATVDVQVIEDLGDPTSVTVFIPEMGVYPVYRELLTRAG
jgi:hypothetical protein